MEIPLDDYEKILRLTDGLIVDATLGESGWEFTAEDVSILGKIWAEIAVKRSQPIVCRTMSDRETLEYFGLLNT